MDNADGTEATTSENTEAVTSESTPSEAPREAPVLAPASTEVAAPQPWPLSVDESTAKYVSDKGWDKSPDPAAAMLQSYQNLEQLLGSKGGLDENTVVLLHEGSTKDEVSAFYNKLGRPETSDKYDISEITNTPDTMRESLVEMFHDTGITQKQSQSIISWVNAQNVQMEEQVSTQLESDQNKQLQALETEWGAAFDKNVQIAQETVDKLGWDEHAINSLQANVGYDGVCRMLHAMGVNMGESAFISGDNIVGDDSLTPSDAQKELDKLYADSAFTAAWLDKDHLGHPAAIEKTARLSAYVVGSKN